MKLLGFQKHFIERCHVASSQGFVTFATVEGHDAGETSKKKDGRAPGLVSCQTLSSTRGKRYRMWTEKKMLDAQVRSALGFLSNCIYVNFDGQS